MDQNSTGKMHRAWLIDDIWYLLCQVFTPPDFALLAQTCKALNVLAIPQLWTNIKSYEPLLSCLPPGYENALLTAADFERWDLHAVKVQSLVMETDNNHSIQLPPRFDSNLGWRKRGEAFASGKTWTVLWKEIARHRPTAHFLPNVRHLRFNNVVGDYLIPIVGISGANLERIYIKNLHGKLSDLFVKRFLTDLQEVPKLEDLFVRNGGYLIPEKILVQAPLRRLRMDPKRSDGQAFALRTALLKKDTLESFTIPLSEYWCTPEIEKSKQKFFPALKKLWLNLTLHRGHRCLDPYTDEHNNSVQPGINDPCRNSYCSWKSPGFFFSRLANPTLEILNVQFQTDEGSTIYLDVLAGASDHLRLHNLTELVLSANSWINHSDEFDIRDPPNIQPAILRQGVMMLLPLPCLKTLRIGVAPNFLNVLDLELYKTITCGLPMLENLTLGHREFATGSRFSGSRYYERMPLHHIAAFCHMLPNLKKVEIGTVDGLALEESPRKEWASAWITGLKVNCWAGKSGHERGGVSRERLHLCVKTYFPASDLAKIEFEETLGIFW